MKAKNSLFALSKDIMTLTAGILVANIIPLLLQPFLKRTFAPEEFGMYDVYLKSFTILVALSSLKYENAILLPKKDSDSKQIVLLCLLISISIFLLLSIFIFLFSDTLAEYFIKTNTLGMVLLPISVLFYSVFNIFNLYLIRRRKFMLSSTSKVSRRLSEGLVQGSLGIVGNSNGLIIGDLIGNIVQGVYSFWKAKKISAFKILSKEKIKTLAIEYKELPLYTLIPNLLNTFVLGSLTFLILGKFDFKEVGFLEFTQKILSIPAVFISVAISQVVFQRVSNMVNKKEKIVPLILSVMSLLLFISLAFIATIEFFGESIFVLIGGNGWEKSGEYAKILVYASATMLIFSPLGKVLIALKRFKVNSLWEMGKFVVILFLFFLEGYTIYEYLVIYTVIIIFFYIAYGIIILYQSHKYQLENSIKT